MGLLNGKVAIVTGAGRGVGRGEALELARQGAKVVVNDLGGTWDGSGADETPAQKVVEEIESAGGVAIPNYDDVADWAGAQHLIDEAIDAFGTLDILINNAGILRDRMIFNMQEEDWDAVVRVHGKGHFCPTHFACRYWRESAKRSGNPVNARLVHTTSASGLFGNAGQANYSFAKAGIASLSLVVAREMARYGVTSNTVAPRARTRLTELTFGGLEVPDTGFDSWHPDNVAPFVAYLCTDQAADISGQCFIVGGGAIDVVGQHHPANTISRDGPFAVEEFFTLSADLFGDRPTRFADRVTSVEAAGLVAKKASV